MAMRRATSGTFFLSLSLSAIVLLVNLVFFLFLSIRQTQAATLSSLPFGTVIQLPNTDTVTNRPYYMVKMQARDGAGNPVSSSNTYWVMLDNYCWWDKANCYYGTFSSESNYQTSWNANAGSSADTSNNLSLPYTHNYFVSLTNFYNSLAANIGGVAKATAIPLYAWEMRPVSSGYGYNTSQVKSGCVSDQGVGWPPSIWTAGTKTINGINYTFSDAATCTVTSRINLVSYDEWQGSVISYKTLPSGDGSGLSFCQARFGRPCTSSDFSDFNTPYSHYQPWTRTPSQRSTQNRDGVWSIYYDSSSYFMYDFIDSSGAHSVMPALWLSSSLATACGAGTYANPYKLTGDPACNTAPTFTMTAPTAGIYRSAVSGYNTFSFSGTVADPDPVQTIKITYDVDHAGIVVGQPWGSTATPYSGAWNGTSSSLSSLSEGAHTLYINVSDNLGAWGTEIGRTFYMDKSTPNLSITNSSTTWYNTTRSGVVTAADNKATYNAGLGGVRYAWTTTNPFTSLATCQSSGTVTNNGATLTAPVGGAILWLCAYDNVGNYVTTSGTYRYENTKPTITVNNSSP